MTKPMTNAMIDPMSDPMTDAMLKIVMLGLFLTFAMFNSKWTQTW